MGCLQQHRIDEEKFTLFFCRIISATCSSQWQSQTGCFYSGISPRHLCVTIAPLQKKKIEITKQACKALFSQSAVYPELINKYNPRKKIKRKNKLEQLSLRVMFLSDDKFAATLQGSITVHSTRETCKIFECLTTTANLISFPKV